MSDGAPVDGVRDIEFPYMCFAEDENGAPCTSRFVVGRAYRAHVRQAHSVKHLVAECVVTNACLYCSSTFASRAIALRHMKGAIQSGQCFVDRRPVPVCDEEFVVFATLPRNLCELHLPQPGCR